MPDSTSLEMFQYESTTMRTAVVAGEPWFAQADTLALLDLNRSSASSLDEDEKGVHTVDTLGGPQKIAFVSESGFYSLILRSRKPEAKAIKRWITREVLPTIRKTGNYSAAPKPAELTRSDLARMVLAAEAELADTKAELEQAAPAAAAWDALAEAEGDYSLRDAAQILSRDPAITTGQNRLMVSIRELGMVDGTGQPYQRHIAHLQLRVTSYPHPHTSEPVLSKQLRVTVLGLKYLHSKLGGTQPLRLIQSVRKELGA